MIVLKNNYSLQNTPFQLKKKKQEALPKQSTASPKSKISLQVRLTG